MKSAKDIKHLLIELYSRNFGGGPDELEIWKGEQDEYVVWRKDDGMITTIPKSDVDLYLSDSKPSRDQGRSRIIAAFHSFRQPIDTARLNDRYSYESPDFVYVKFRIEKGPEEKRVRVLNVIDSSKSGLAMLVTRKDADLIELLDEGDKIREMSFLGIGARIKGDGTVKHLSKIVKGKFKGCYILGAEALDLVK